MVCEFGHQDCRDLAHFPAPDPLRVLRICIVGHELIRGHRCPVHQSTAARGYGGPHQAARTQLAGTLPAACGYCGIVISPDERWVAAHRMDGQPRYGYLVAHPACNERAKGGGATWQG